MTEFLRIGGINHERYVGISKEDGKAYDFYILNLDGYRPAETAEEEEACFKKAEEYYLNCAKRVRTGDFSIEYYDIDEWDVEDEAARLLEE